MNHQLHIESSLFSPLTRIYYQSCGEVYSKVCVSAYFLKCFIVCFVFLFLVIQQPELGLKKEMREMLSVVVYKESFSVGDAL